MEKYTILPDTTRVWIYQSSRPFSDNEVEILNRQLNTFADQWVSHNQQLQAFGKIFHNQFVVLMVDESQAGASGCSIDKSVHFVKNLEQLYGVSLFDRMTFAYKDNDEIQTVSKDEFASLYKNKNIDDNTLVFDNLVNNKKSFEEQWLKPLGESWHKRLI